MISLELQPSLHALLLNFPNPTRFRTSSSCYSSPRQHLQYAARTYNLPPCGSLRLNQQSRARAGNGVRGGERFCPRSGMGSRHSLQLSSSRYDEMGTDLGSYNDSTPLIATTEAEFEEAMSLYPVSDAAAPSAEKEVGFFGKQETVWKLAVVMSLVGLQVCSRAWAGSEVPEVAASSGLGGLGDFSDIQSGFASAFLLIFFSEIGDKTFFIAALLATRKSSIAVFSGTFGALVAMTLISVTLGRVFHYIDEFLPSFGNGDRRLPLDDIAAVILLVYFGISTLLEAAYMEENGEEKQEAELAIADVGLSGAVAGTVASTFALVFVAEWGDKSFFSTIALAAAASPLGVVTGAMAGHGAATLLAVLGGSFLGNYISERVIAYVGGVLFLVFAGATLVEILN